MSKKAPPIPPEQRSFRGPRPKLSEHHERRDQMTGLQSYQPGDDDTNIRTQGRYGNLRQNLTPLRRVQAR